MQLCILIDLETGAFSGVCVPSERIGSPLFANEVYRFRNSRRRSFVIFYQQVLFM
jgi:hypothetical protein